LPPAGPGPAAPCCSRSFFKLRDFAARRPTTPASVPAPERPRGLGGGRRGSPPPRLREQSPPVALPARRTPRLPAAGKGDGCLAPRSHPRRGDSPGLGGVPVPVPVPSAGRGRSRGTAGFAVQEKAPMGAAMALPNPDPAVISGSPSPVISRYHY